MHKSEAGSFLTLGRANLGLHKLNLLDMGVICSCSDLQERYTNGENGGYESKVTMCYTCKTKEKASL